MGLLLYKEQWNTLRIFLYLTASQACLFQASSPRIQFEPYEKNMDFMSYFRYNLAELPKEHEYFK